jgi:hypothetical protein
MPKEEKKACVIKSLSQLKEGIKIKELEEMLGIDLSHEESKVELDEDEYGEWVCFVGPMK